MTQTQKVDLQAGISLDKYKICPSCGNFCNVTENQVYCISCGEKLIEECYKCKEPIIYPQAKYCYKCGNELRK